jgi:chromosome segregation ATPase
VFEVMFFGIGFLAASLVGLVVLPLVHNRAVQLTMKRLAASAPLSMTEVQAEKDQLRAEFAMWTRRLELSVEQMKARTTGWVVELGKKSDAINRLKAELREKTAAISPLEARQKALTDQLRVIKSELTVKTAALREAERILQENQAELVNLAADLNERSGAGHSARVEVTSLRLKVQSLKDQISGYEREARELGDRLARSRKDSAAATVELQEERGKAEKLSNRVSQLKRQLIAQTTEAEVLGRRVQEVTAQTAHQAKMMPELDAETGRLRDKVVEIHNIEAQLRADLAAASGRNKAATENLLKETVIVQDQLNKAKAERTKLQQEIASMKREAEETLAAVRIDNALLRERINDIAADFARLAVALEGPNSPIGVILASEPTASNAANGGRRRAFSGTNGKGDLADRIRAL